jgi:hypothetical protein
MSELVDNAFEPDSLIIGDEPNVLGFFVGGVLPHVAVPDAPAYSWYYRTTGERYQLGSGDAALLSSWVVQTPVWHLPIKRQTVVSKLPSAQVAYCPVQLIDGSRRNLAVIDGQVFLKMRDGRVETLQAVA